MIKLLRAIQARLDEVHLGPAHPHCKTFNKDDALGMFENRERYIEQSRTGELPPRPEAHRNLEPIK
jgi:hypothetical protein